MALQRSHRRTSEPSSLRPLLEGGDRRSIARSDEARTRALANPSLVGELVALAKDADWLVSLRALDLLEKLAHDHPAWVNPYRRVFIGPLADSEQWERRLQVVRALPCFTWTNRERPRVLRILQRDLKHPQLFVKAWALDSLSRFAQGDAALRPIVLQYLAVFDRSGRPALLARARDIRRRLRAASQTEGGGAARASHRKKRIT